MLHGNTTGYRPHQRINSQIRADSGEAPEALILETPLIVEVHATAIVEYRSHIVLIKTFGGGNRYVLKRIGLAEKVN